MTVIGVENYKFGDIMLTMEALSQMPKDAILFLTSIIAFSYVCLVSPGRIKEDISSIAQKLSRLFSKNMKYKK